MVALKHIWSSFWTDATRVGAAGLALLVLFGSVLLNRYRIDALPLRPQIEHIVILLVGCVLVVLLVQKRARLQFQPSDLLIAGYLAVALGSSLLFPPDPGESIQYWARMTLAVAVYFLTRWLMTATTPGVFLRLAVKALIIFGVLEALFGIGSWLLYPFGINLGVDEYPLGIRGPGGVLCNFSLTMYGTLWEPNVYASTLMFVVLVGAVLFVSSAFRAWRKPLGVAIAIMLLALALNASRAAFLTLALGFIPIVLIAEGMSLVQKAIWAGSALLFILVVTLPAPELSRVLMQMPGAPGLAKRAPCAAWIAAGMPRSPKQGTPANDPDTGPDSDLNGVNRLLEGQTLISRLVSYRRAWGDFVERPWLGNGANSFGQKYTTTAHTPEWISNFVLMSLHDTGILGTLILAVWFAGFGWTALRALRVPPPAPARGLGEVTRGNLSRTGGRAILFALSVGLLGLFLAYLVTTLLWFGLIWFLFALTEAGVQVLRAEARAPATQEASPSRAAIER